MLTFILLITLMTPKGDTMLISEPYPTKEACKMGLDQALKDTQRRPMGFKVHEAACHAVMQVAEKKP